MSDEALYTYAVTLFGRLLLPPTRLRLRESATTKALDVYDRIRRRWVALTPEEWVRQHFVAYMTDELGYSAMRIANEVSLNLNGTQRRADTVVYDDNLKPLVLVEYKAPTVALTAEAVHQVMRYNLVFGARAAMITNGLDVYTIRNTDICRGVMAPGNL